MHTKYRCRKSCNSDLEGIVDMINTAMLSIVIYTELSMQIRLSMSDGIAKKNSTLVYLSTQKGPNSVDFCSQTCN